MNSTLEYYNDRAEEFTAGTLNVKFDKLQDEFCSYIKPSGSILDLGCGSGRDSRAFMDKGYEVTAVDGSEKLCILASEYLGQKVECATFQEYMTDKTFDGIWACASLLHLEADEIPGVIRKYTDMLNPGGCFYVSFKYGSFTGERNGRFFTDMDEESLGSILSDIPELTVDRQFITSDARPEKENEKWLNAFLVKK